MTVNNRIILAIPPASLAAERVVRDILNSTMLLFARLLEAFRTRLAIIRAYQNGRFMVWQEPLNL